MNKKQSETKYYYSIPESFTQRKDLDPVMKWVLTNFDNKLRIPKEMLPDGEYTFSVSNVAAEMGIPFSTCWDKFKKLQDLGVILNVGELKTHKGTVIKYQIDTERFSKVMNGEILMQSKSHTKRLNAGVLRLPIKVGSPPPDNTTPPPDNTTPPPDNTTPPPDNTTPPPDMGSPTPDTINQIEQSNELIKESKHSVQNSETLEILYPVTHYEIEPKKDTVKLELAKRLRDSMKSFKKSEAVTPTNSETPANVVFEMKDIETTGTQKSEAYNKVKTEMIAAALENGCSYIPSESAIRHRLLQLRKI